MWIESETENVVCNLVFLEKCLIGSCDGPPNHSPGLDVLNPWAVGLDILSV